MNADAAQPRRSRFLDWLVHRAWFGPALMAALFVLLLGGLLWLMQQQVLDFQRTDLVSSAGGTRDAIRRRLDTNRQFLLLLAEDAGRGRLDEQRFSARAEQYLADHPELVRITFMDEAGEIRWSTPRDFDLPSAALQAKLPEPRIATNDARRLRRPIYTMPFIPIKGDTAFELHVPVVQDDLFAGTFVGVYSCIELLRHALPQETMQKNRASLVTLSGNEVVALPAASRVDERLTTVAALDPPGHGLGLELQRYGTGFWGWGLASLTVLCLGLVLGMALGMWSLNRQVARRAAAEEALRAARDELESRVRQRTADLETEMHERQKAEERLRQHQDQLTHVARVSTMGEMAAGLAHELHQPLGAIASFAEGGLMRIESGDADPAELTHALSEVSAHAQRAGRIIHRLRDFVSNRGPRKAITKVDRLVGEVVELMAIDARQNQVTLDVDVPADLPDVLVDRTQVQQVLLNLMRNGIEAMHETPPAERHLRVRATRNGDHSLEFTVTDAGPGCPPDRLPKIFDPFYTTKDTGMGMGLSISRSIVEAHEGKLWANVNGQAPGSASPAPSNSSGEGVSPDAPHAARNGHGFTIAFTLPILEPTHDD
jgi:signal transduction histidine kinase